MEFALAGDGGDGADQLMVIGGMAAAAGAARAVQGVGAGGLIALSPAVIADIAGPRQRAKYQGYVLAVLGMSTVLGPVLGGFFAGVALAENPIRPGEGRWGSEMLTRLLDAGPGCSW